MSELLATPPEGPLWIVDAVYDGRDRRLSAHVSQNAAMKAARRIKASGAEARVWHVDVARWLTPAEAHHRRVQPTPDLGRIEGTA